MYYGLRLDYEGTSFTPDAESYGVLRFRASNAANSHIPRSPANGGDVEDPYPLEGRVSLQAQTDGWDRPSG
jgi:hypothetical protein